MVEWEWDSGDVWNDKISLAKKTHHYIIQHKGMGVTKMGGVTYHLQLSSVCIDGHQHIREVRHNLCEGDPAILVHIHLFRDVGNLVVVQVKP